MVNGANYLANLITQKISTRVSLMCREIQQEHGQTSVPSYFYLRSQIQEILESALKDLVVEYRFSPIEVERFHDQEGYWKHTFEKLAVEVGKQIFKEELYNFNEFNDKDSWFGTKRFHVVVLDVATIENEFIKKEETK